MKPNYELRVGMFTLFALILLLWGWGWLKSASMFQAPQRFVVRFHDIAGLNKNATVNINGVRVGVVEKIELKSKGVVLVYLKITAPEVIVTQGSTVTIQTLGLVGAKYVEISLPSESPGQPPPPPLKEGEVVVGQDPVRVELVVNELASKIHKVADTITSDEAEATVRNIKEAAGKFNQNMDRLAAVAVNVNETSRKFGTVADSAGSFFKQGSSTFKSVQALSGDWRNTSGRLNKLLENPNITQDLKETATLAKQTADKVSATINQLNATFGDEPTRKDLITMLNQVNQSTQTISESVKVLNTLARDGEIRSDVRAIVSDARDAMNKLDTIISGPEFKADIKGTLYKVQSAADNVDLASRQLSQILGKRAPLLRMLFGRPGRIERDKPRSDKSDRPRADEMRATQDLTKSAQ